MIGGILKYFSHARVSEERLYSNETRFSHQVNFVNKMIKKRPENEYVSESANHSMGFVAAAKGLGVSFKEVERKKFDFYRKRQKIGSLDGMNSSLVTRSARRVCKDKSKSYKSIKNSVNAPWQLAYRPSQLEKAFNVAKKKNFDVVVKPSCGRAGQGVGVGPFGEDGFRNAWQQAVNSLTTDSDCVVMEQRVSGVDVRATVVGGRLHSAIARVQAYVIGHDDLSIGDLVHEKNGRRSRNPHLRKYPIDIDSEMNLCLANQGRSLADVPKGGEVVVLRGAANIHLGGEAVDVTDELGTAVRRQAERAAQSVQGLEVVGVDFVVSNIGEYEEAAVIEMNAGANFCMSYFPVVGTPRNPAIAVIERMIELAEADH